MATNYLKEYMLVFASITTGLGLTIGYRYVSNDLTNNTHKVEAPQALSAPSKSNMLNVEIEKQSTPEKKTNFAEPTAREIELEVENKRLRNEVLEVGKHRESKKIQNSKDRVDVQQLPYRTAKIDGRRQFDKIEKGASIQMHELPATASGNIDVEIAKRDEILNQANTFLNDSSASWPTEGVKIYREALRVRNSKAVSEKGAPDLDRVLEKLTDSGIVYIRALDIKSKPLVYETIATSLLKGSLYLSKSQQNEIKINLDKIK